jgi:carbonic anhydrase
VLKKLQHLISANRTWAEAQLNKDPDFFKRLESQQSPEFFWIGCSDSRVPANIIVDLQPGEVFVHRNVANQVFHGDLNGQSATQFAVEILKVKHIIVCGHYGCSGVRMAMRGDRVGLADAWVRPIHQIARRHGLLLEGAGSEATCLDMLCELNVIEQVKHLCESTLIEDAWDRGQNLTVHAWLYSLKNGLITNLDMSVSDVREIDSLYSEAVDAVKARYTR